MPGFVQLRASPPCPGPRGTFLLSTVQNHKALLYCNWLCKDPTEHRAESNHWMLTRTFTPFRNLKYARANSLKTFNVTKKVSPVKSQTSRSTSASSQTLTQLFICFSSGSDDLFLSSLCDPLTYNLPHSLVESPKAQC